MPPMSCLCVALGRRYTHGCAPEFGQPILGIEKEPLADWEIDLLNCTSKPECADNNAHPEGMGMVTFTRTDGTKFLMDNVYVDTISGAATNNGIISMDTLVDGKEIVVHLPYIQSWTVEYRI